MKSIISLFILSLLFAVESSAQLKHTISYNALSHVNFFNKEKDKFFFPPIYREPSVSYKISQKRIGVEINFINFYGQNYYPKWEYKLVPDSSILQVTSSLISLNFLYTLFDQRFLKINAGLGFSRRWLDQIELYYWFQNYHLVGDILSENNNSINAILNSTIPVYKGAFFQSNFRYNYFPNSRLSKQNFILEFGIGYTYQRKKSTTKN